MADKLKQAIDEISESYENAAFTFFKAGMEFVYSARQKEAMHDSQVGIANIGISIELLLKTVISKKCFSLLFKKIPDDLKITASYPEALPKEANLNSQLLDLREATFDTVELNEALGLFYRICPRAKDELGSFCRDVSDVRNKSVHSVISRLNYHLAERLAYLEMRLVLMIEDQFDGLLDFFELSKDDLNFLKQFEQERSDRIRKHIKETITKAKDLSGPYSSPTIGFSWEQFILPCPVCKNGGVSNGETIPNEERSVHGELEDVTLTFHVYTFHCGKCGLKLDDPEEVRLGGVETSRDRSQDAVRWYNEGLEE